MINVHKIVMCLTGTRPDGKLCTGAKHSQLRHWIHGLQATKPLPRQAATVQCLEQLSEELIPRLMYHLPLSYCCYENELMIRRMSSRSKCINRHNGSLILLDYQ
jgi:hypothetical protein